MNKDSQHTEDMIYHDSRSLIYRSPFGAVSTGTSVDIRVDVRLPLQEVKLCYSYGLYTFYYSEMHMDPVMDEPFRFHVNIRMPGEPGLFFYWFSVRPMHEMDPVPEILERSRTTDSFDGAHHEGVHHEDARLGWTRQEVWQPDIHVDEGASKQYYVFSSEKSDGTGRISDMPSRTGAQEDRNPSAFQITVYDKAFKTPDWFKGAVLYQIFPDRFFRGSSYVKGQMQAARTAEERIYHEDWHEDVDIEGKPETGYLACDFFGGTLDGIAEKVPYLKDLHVDCLYLNPIFEARSNHRYDTADYLAADPMLGGNDAFDRFSDVMHRSGIAFFLDGVFSHTGADSRYFNKLLRYPGNGAYQSAQGKGRSPYASWYTFYQDGTGKLAYDSWWGFTDLPNVNENDLSFRDFVLGEKGVIQKWLRRGAAGFRLDVSDELPDSFLREIRQAVKEYTDQKGIVIGEVWEDASNKISFGSYRDFLYGSSHDSVMGYTFREAVLGYLSGSLSAQAMNNRLESYRENYPPEAYYCIMNLLSSHDVPRAITVISGAADPGVRKLQSTLSMDEQQVLRGMALMRLGLVLQMGYIGAPCIYYGDEIGMQGYKDPFNRRTYPWDRLSEAQARQLDYYKEMTGLRRRFPVLRTGYYRTLWAQDDVFIFERFLDPNHTDYFRNACDGAYRVVVAVHRGDSRTFSFNLLEENDKLVVLPKTEEGYNDKEDSQITERHDTEPITVRLPPLSSKIISYQA
jgi:glycosidase